MERREARRAKAGRTQWGGLWACLLCALCGEANQLWADASANGLILSIVLKPVTTRPELTVLHRGPSLRIEIKDVNETGTEESIPPPAGRDEVIEGGRIPTVPHTPFFYSITEQELRVDASRVAGTGPTSFQVYKSSTDPAGHAVFSDLRVYSLRGSLKIPYTLDLVGYKDRCGGWFYVRSGWEQEFEFNGYHCILGIIDNLDGTIDKRDVLYIKERRQGTVTPLINDCPVPRVLTLKGHTLRLDTEFEQVDGVVVLRAVIHELHPRLGRLNVETSQCDLMCLQDGDEIVILEDPGASMALPVGDYNVADVIVAHDPDPTTRFPKFLSYDSNVVIEPCEPAFLRIGPPLVNTVEVIRDRKGVCLDYRLVGRGQERYTYRSLTRPATLQVHKGRFRVTQANVPWG